MTTSARPAELNFLGATARVLASADGLGLVHIDMPAGEMPPLHIHHNEDEGFYVLGGEITLFLPGEKVRLGAGDFLLAPRGVPHAYQVGDAPARFLVLSSPGGFEAFVRDAAALDELTPESLGATAAVHDIEILGPPGTLP